MQKMENSANVVLVWLGRYCEVMTKETFSQEYSAENRDKLWLRRKSVVRVLMHLQAHVAIRHFLTDHLPSHRLVIPERGRQCRLAALKGRRFGAHLWRHSRLCSSNTPLSAEIRHRERFANSSRVCPEESERSSCGPQPSTPIERAVTLPEFIAPSTVKSVLWTGDALIGESWGAVFIQ
jgi:hypothetical protein